MLSIRCQLAVKAELEKLGLEYLYVKIGEAEITRELLPEELKRFNKNLKKIGLELVEDKKSILVEKMRNIIIELVHFSEDQIKVNLSDFLSEKLNYDYTYLSNLFSESKGVSIEKFYISHKIERVKELLIYDELNISEIAYKMHYSSVAHLSNQFKKFTGLTPSNFKMLKIRNTGTIDDV